AQSLVHKRIFVTAILLAKLPAAAVDCSTGKQRFIANRRYRRCSLVYCSISSSECRGAPMIESRPPFPPFTLETATQKVRMAEDAWNTRDPRRVALAYTTDRRWRNRGEFVQGRAEMESFLTSQCQRGL